MPSGFRRIRAGCMSESPWGLRTGTKLHVEWQLFAYYNDYSAALDLSVRTQAPTPTDDAGPIIELLLSTDPSCPQSSAVHFGAAQIDCEDSPRIGDVLERVCVQHDEVTTLACLDRPDVV